MKAASGGEFGGRLDDARHDHGDDEVALPAGGRIEDGIQLQVVQATEDCGGMAVRPGAGDAETIRQRGGGGSQRTGEGEAEGFNLTSAEMSDVGEGAGFDFAVLAIGFAEEDGGRGVAVGDGGHVHAYIIHAIHILINIKSQLIHAYAIARKTF